MKRKKKEISIEIVEKNEALDCPVVVRVMRKVPYVWMWGMWGGMEEGDVDGGND